LLRLTSIKLGAQNVHHKESGAYTGEVSLPMINEWIKVVIVGHSERRKEGETSKEINEKLKLIFDFGLKAILCIGESYEDFKRGNNEIILDQLKEALTNISSSKVKEDLIIAYEPVWAIGTGIPARADYIERNVFLIRQFISSLYNKEIGANVPILYGGSVNAQNVSEFVKNAKVNGFLVGGASLDPKEFVAICRQTKEA
jgi:triosephosphate isomerase